MLRRALYWLAVVVVSLALVVCLVLVLEAQDRSSLSEPSSRAAPTATPQRA